MTRLPKKKRKGLATNADLAQIIEYLETVRNQPSPNTLTRVTTRGTFIEAAGKSKPGGPSNDLAVWL